MGPRRTGTSPAATWSRACVTPWPERGPAGRGAGGGRDRFRQAGPGLGRRRTAVSGALGGIFPCQVGVMAAWATGVGQASIDREPYLPREWTEDRARCRRARVPDGARFAVKPRLAERMISGVLPDLPGGRVWVAADEVYGRDGTFRRTLEDHGLPYVVTVQANQSVLPRPGWRHLARLVERHATEEQWIELPAWPSQLESHLAMVGTPGPRRRRAPARDLPPRCPPDPSPGSSPFPALTPRSAAKRPAGCWPGAVPRLRPGSRPAGPTQACTGHDGGASTRPSPVPATAGATRRGTPPDTPHDQNYDQNRDLRLKGRQPDHPQPRPISPKPVKPTTLPLRHNRDGVAPKTLASCRPHRPAY
ncbi:transposase [Streptomyces sp. NPDC001635]